MLLLCRIFWIAEPEWPLFLSARTYPRKGQQGILGCHSNCQLIADVYLLGALNFLRLSSLIPQNLATGNLPRPLKQPGQPALLVL